MKMLMPMQSSEQIRIAVKDTITAPEYQKEFEKIMTDPQFASEFAKAINSQSKQLHMQLIKDPTYQKSVGDIMKSPEVSKMFMDMTKTPEYRKQTMTVMQEVMQNPLFRMEVLTLLKKWCRKSSNRKLNPAGRSKVDSKKAAVKKVEAAATAAMEVAVVIPEVAEDHNPCRGIQLIYS